MKTCACGAPARPNSYSCHECHRRHQRAYYRRKRRGLPAYQTVEDGMTFVQIAQQLGISRQAAQATFARAVEKLQHSRALLDLYLEIARIRDRKSPLAAAEDLALEDAA